MEFGDVFMLPGWVKKVDLSLSEAFGSGFLSRQPLQCATLVIMTGLKGRICASPVRKQTAIPA